MRLILIQACNSICLQPIQKKKTSGYLTLILTLYLWNKYNKPLSCRSQWRKPTAPTWHPTSLCPQHEGNSKSQLQQNTSFHCKLFKYLPILHSVSTALHTRTKNHLHHKEDEMSFLDSAFISNVMSFQSSAVVCTVLVWNYDKWYKQEIISFVPLPRIPPFKKKKKRLKSLIYHPIEPTVTKYLLILLKGT